jgi:hypothetical protein
MEARERREKAGNLGGLDTPYLLWRQISRYINITFEASDPGKILQRHLSLVHGTRD